MLWARQLWAKQRASPSLKDLVSAISGTHYSLGLILQLPDDVRQNLEDAGARYIPYALSTLELLIMF